MSKHYDTGSGTSKVLLNKSDRLVRLPDGSAADPLDLPTIELIVRTGYMNTVARANRDAIIADVVGSIEDESSSLPALDRMQALSGYLETEISRRLQSHSALFWLTFYREIQRMNPVESFSEPDDFTRQVRYTELSMAKHGSLDASDIRFIDSLWAIEPNEADMLALLEVCGMAGLAAAVRIDCRRLAMGGRLITTDGDWRTIFDEDLNGLVETYIARRRRYANIFHHAGVSGQGTLPPGRGKHWITMAGKTVGDITWSGLSKTYLVRPPKDTDELIGEDDEYRPNFGLQEFTLDADISWLNIVDAELEASEGFSIAAALALINAIAIVGFERAQTLRAGHRLRSTALMVVDAEEILSRAAQELGSSESTRGPELHRALSFFTRPTSARAAIVPGSVFDLRHIIRINTGQIVVDYATIFSSVWQLFNFLGTVENLPAKRRATAFENGVSQQVCSAVPLAKPWVVSQELRFTNGTKREIDVALIVNDTLLLCECKSMTRRPPDDVPSPGRLANRWQSLQDALDQVDSLAILLSSQELRRPRPIPSEVKCIVPCVVTPSAEWIPSGHERFWFSEDIPRFCTIGEVIHIARIIGSGSPLPNRRIRVT